MTKEKFKNFIQKENPEIYNEAKNEVRQEYEEIKKRGGARIGAGRHKITIKRINVYSRLSTETVSLIITYKNEHNLKTKNEAIEELIKAGFNHKKNVWHKY